MSKKGIVIEVGDAKTNRDTIINIDGKPLGFINKIILDTNGSYAEVRMINEESDDVARALVSYGFIVNRI